MNRPTFSLKNILVIALFTGASSIKSMAQENAFTFLFSLEAGNPKVSYRGNVFELQVVPSDTVLIEDIETGTMVKKVTRIDSRPIKMNDLLIAGREEVQAPALPKRSLDEYFIDFALKNKNQFNQLADGRYRIDVRHFVISEEGKMVYYKFDGLETIQLPGGTENDENNKQIILDINRLIHQFIISEEMHFDAAEKDRKKVLSVILDGANVGITVKDHKMSVDL